MRPTRAASLKKQEHETLRHESEGRSNGAQPLRMLDGTVPAEWIDYNGHMTEHRYLDVFSKTTDALLERIGAGTAYVASGRSYYTVETHIMHLGEAKVGQAYRSTTQILSADDKRIHVFHSLHAADGATLATAEMMLLHVDMGAGRAGPAAREVLERLIPMAVGHTALARPREAGRAVGQAR